MKRLLLIINCICLFCPMLFIGQHFSLPENKKFEKINFELINNLIIVPVEVNGTSLSFVLDSGVSTPILFNLADQDSIQLNSVSEISINGLGGGEPITALSSSNNVVKLGNLLNADQQVLVVMDAGINFSPTLGIPVHGIIGYDLFKDFVVDINYTAHKIKFHDPKTYISQINKNTEALAISVINRKAYLDADVIVKGNKEIRVKMLLDTGSSDAIWLFENDILEVPEQYYMEFLGRGLAGDIYGKRTKIKKLRMGSFILEDAKSAFPDMRAFDAKKDLGNRNGSLGGEVLKRFNIVFDFPNERIFLKKNGNFKKPYQFNISGIDLQHAGLRYVTERMGNSQNILYKEERSYGDVQLLLEGATRLSLVPEIIVSGIRAGSPAHSAGLREGDVILAVNGKRIHRYRLQEVLEMLNSKRDGRRIKVLVERSNNDLLFSFELKDIFEK